MNHWPQLSVPLENATLRVISHGGGVQTTALCLMAARGEVGPMPDCAIFADTGGEPASVYLTLEWLRAQVPFPIHVVRRPGLTLGQLTEAVANGSIGREGTPLPPLFYPDPQTGRLGMMRKHCSGEYKREVVTRAIRELVGLAPGQRLRPHQRRTVEVWIGMSTDELFRVATSRYPLIHNRHPLVEQDLTRQGCIQWLQERQYPVPSKSSCVFCPYRTNAQWRWLRDNAPAGWSEAVRFDAAIRDGFRSELGAPVYLHRSCVALDQADLRDEHPDQLALPMGADCDACGL
jgi:hypothetical protein